MDPSKEPDVHPYPDTAYSSEEEGTSAGQLQGPYAVVDRDHQSIDVSSQFIDDWADIDYPLDDSIFCPNLCELNLNDTSGAQPTAQTAQDGSGSNVSSGQIGATVLPSNSEIDLTDMSPDDSDSCADISELDLNDTLEAQLPAPTARDASDLDTSSDQTQAKATPSVSDTSYLDSEVKLLSAKIWEMAHLYWSDIPGLNVASEVQPTAPTAHPSSSNIPDPNDASQAQPTDPTTISPLASDISDLSETLTPESAANTANAVSDFALLAGHWPAPDPSTREWGAAYVPSTAVNETPVLPFDPIWYTPASIRNFKPLPVPPPTYENGGLPSTEPSTEPSSSENLVPDVADDTIDPMQAVNPEAVSGHVSPKIEPRRTIYDFVAAVGAYIRPFFNF
ncbi:hypothetical protein ARSEF4850_007055 [Beauveria asiatica]